MSFYLYKNEKEIAIGDVVAQKSSVDPEEIGYHGFMTAIVEDIDKEHNLAMLCRPHLQTQKIGCTNGTAMIMCERYAVGLQTMTSQFVCYTRGPRGEKDNRGNVI